MEKSSTLDEAEHNQIYNALASALGGALESVLFTFALCCIISDHFDRRMLRAL